MAPSSTLDILPRELRAEIFEHVFPEGRTTVSLTAFCNLSTDSIDVYHLKSDDDVSTLGALADLAKFNLRLPHAIFGPHDEEIMSAFWRNAKFIINIFDESVRNPFHEPFHLSANFLAQAAGKMQHLIIKIYLTRAADSQALAQSPAIQNTFYSCHQDFEIKTFAHRTGEGRMPLLSVTSQQLLGITHTTPPTADLTERETWCKDFLEAAREPTQGRGPSGVAIRILLLKLSSCDSVTTSNAFLTVSPVIVRQWEAMDAGQAGSEVVLGTFITPAGNAFANSPPLAPVASSSIPTALT